MTSKLIVNSLAADTGVSTITFADQAKMGNSLFHSTGFTIGDSFLHSTGVNLTNINATGVITATKFVGEVSVGSSITFEDNEKAYFGTGTDFSIYHNGSASYLDETGTGGLIAKTNTAFQVFNSAGSQPAFTVTPGGAVDLYHNTTKVLETKAYGIDITGGFVATGDCSIADKITHAGDLNTAIRFPSNDTITFETGSVERLRIFPSGNVNIGAGSSGSGLSPILHLHKNASSTAYLHITNNNTGITNNDGFLLGINGVGDCLVFNKDETPIRFATAGIERVRITSTGKVSIGNESSPLGTLHVKEGDSGVTSADTSQDTLFLESNGNAGLTIATPNANTGYLTFADPQDSNVGQIIYRHSDNSMSMFVNAAERLRIDSYGVLRVGNTHAQTTSGITKRIALGAKASIWGWTSGNINGALTLADNYYWDGANNKAIENDYSAYLTLRSGNLRFGTTNQTHSAGGNISGGIHEKFRIETNGNATINDGNLVIGTNGHGIDFHNYGSGTNISSNLLDDYEEGSAVPDFANADNSIVTVNRYTYTKVGRLVHFEAKFTVGSNNDGSGFGFSLPFGQAGSRETVIPAISTRSGTTTTPFAFVVNANQSYAYAKALDGFSATNCEYVDFAGDIILVSGTYEAN